MKRESAKNEIRAISTTQDNTSTEVEAHTTEAVADQKTTAQPTREQHQTIEETPNTKTHTNNTDTNKQTTDTKTIDKNRTTPAALYKTPLQTNQPQTTTTYKS